MKLNFKLDERHIRFDGIIVGQVENEHIHICLDQLKDAGFEGNVVISDDFVSSRRLIADIKPTVITCEIAHPSIADF